VLHKVFTHCVEDVLNVDWQMYVQNNAQHLQLSIDIVEVSVVKFSCYEHQLPLYDANQSQTQAKVYLH